MQWVMGLLVHFDQRGEYVKVVCLVRIQLMSCQYVDNLSSVRKFLVVVDRPQWMHREELIVGFRDSLIAHGRHIAALLLAHSSSFHVPLVYSACVRNRRTNTLHML